MTVTLGADPELFFKSKEGSHISAINRVGGSKDFPRDLGDGYAVQEDNVAAEFNIPPANDIYRWNEVLNRGIELVGEIASGDGLDLSHAASAYFDKKELRHPKAKEFGCDPDFNAWTVSMNPRPASAKSNFRTAGGHIHVGGIEELDGLQVIRAMDLFLGVPSVLLDADTERRQLYGGAGAYRPKEYGVEYRTLSNFWIFDQKLREWVWEQTIRATEFVRDGNVLEDGTALAASIKSIINGSDKEGAEALCLAYNINLPK